MGDGVRFGYDPISAQADLFRLYVGPGRRFSWDALADATGIPLSTLKSYGRETAPAAMPFHAALRLIAVLPAEAGNMMLAPTGYKLAPIEPDADDWNGIGAEASMLTFEICDAQRDGRIDHLEAGRLRARTASLLAKAASVL
jgi:hypothetical protein